MKNIALFFYRKLETRPHILNEDK